jgi:hypothetical protein
MFRSSARYLENPNRPQLARSNSSARPQLARSNSSARPQLARSNRSISNQSSSRNRKINAIRKKIQTRKIFKFMKNVNPHKRRAFFLKAVCSNSGVCLAFGKENAKIKQHFDFASFNYMTKSKNIGSPSANGFVKLIEYQNEGYLADAILKSSMESTSDNLYYEYLVGQFINKQLLYYPCFLETYETFKYNSDVQWNNIRQNSIIPKSTLQVSLTPLDQVFPGANVVDYLTQSCIHSRHIAILIQSLKDSESFYDMLDSPEFVQQDLAYVIFQIYMPLMCLENTFTHYDLHLANVLMYEPIQNQFIHYHYHMPDGTVVSFKSNYIATIIDYGSCFFNDVTNPGVDGSSSTIHDELCKIQECRPNCGENKGYTYLQPLSFPSNNYMSSVVRNRSHDLRLLNILKREHTPIADVLSYVVYDAGYGTSERANDYPNSIQTVTDACLSFKDVIEEPDMKNRNDTYHEGKTKIGDLHVYSNQTPINFIPTP